MNDYENSIKELITLKVNIDFINKNMDIINKKLENIENKLNEYEAKRVNEIIDSLQSSSMKSFVKQNWWKIPAFIVALVLVLGYVGDLLIHLAKNN